MVDAVERRSDADRAVVIAIEDRILVARSCRGTSTRSALG